MQFYRVDLVSLFQERRWRFLLNLIMNLPRNSLTQEVMSQDPELLEQLISQSKGREDGGTPKAGRIRMRDFSPEVEALFGVTDRLGEVISAVVASNGGKSKQIKPLPRPETAWSRVEVIMREREHRSLVARVLPNG